MTNVQQEGLGIKGVLQGIILLKDLKETPAKLTELLNDAENVILRVVELEDTLQNLMSAIAKFLPQQYLTSLRNTVADVRGAIDALRVDLEPLHGHLRTNTLSTPGSGVRKLWRSVVGFWRSRKMAFRVLRFMDVIRQHFATELRHYHEILVTGNSGLAGQATPKEQKAFIPKKQPEILDKLLQILCHNSAAEALRLQNAYNYYKSEQDHDNVDFCNPG